MRPSRHLFTTRLPSLTLASIIWLSTSLLANSCTRPQPPSTAPLPDGGTGLVAMVDRVTDGDTLTLSFSGAGVERVRLLGIDTPETVKPNSPVECFGPEASARTKHLLPPGTEVLVQRDTEARDRYGRLLVYLWRRADGLFINETLLADGYATILSITPNIAHRPDLARTEQSARRRQLGLWGACTDPAGR
ncbi:MAG: thermonuclease family protein [Microthrixaceae bacterium]|jgi:micrococcal nuclease|nr:thermonuclease family protein [Microthrixaceae bacterium]